jgi:hypothetical protein
MRKGSHWQPEMRKEYMAEDIRDWVRRTSDSTAKLESLMDMTSRDLAVLMLAVLAAERREKK